MTDDTRRRCPDGGTCHGRTIASQEQCEPNTCWRVQNAAPLSGKWNGQWPDWVRWYYRPVEGRFIPEVFEDEWGETWWAEGIVPWRIMVVAVLKNVTVNVDRETAVEILRDIGGRAGAEAHVNHGYWVETNPAEEHMYEADPYTPGAAPFTRLVL